MSIVNVDVKVVMREGRWNRGWNEGAVKGVLFVRWDLNSMMNVDT